MTANLSQYKAEELYFLASACHIENLFGLIDKKSLILKKADCFETARAALIEKQLLDEKGHLTNVGFLTIQLIEKYAQSTRYIRLNNRMYSFTSDQEIIAFSENANQEYQILVYDRESLLINLYHEYTLIRREPSEGEKQYLKKSLSIEEKKKLEEMNFPVSMNLEYFPIEDNRVAREKYEQWLFFEKENNLYAIDVPNEQYTQASQYFLMKKLFDLFQFPYKEAHLV